MCAKHMTTVCSEQLLFLFAVRFFIAYKGRTAEIETGQFSARLGVRETV